MGKVLIIAEAGVNHNGDYELALKLIDAAKEAGADIVKFQTFIPELLVSKNTQKAEYQKASAGEDESQLEMIKKLSLDFNAFVLLKKYCEKVGIEFLSTPFDLISLDFLNSLNMSIFKIPSGEITNLPYLKKIGQIGKPVILSTGMSRLGEIEEALEVLISSGLTNDQITLLHCNTEYPTPMKDVNLQAMNSLSVTFGMKSGYSDHTTGIEVPIAAVAMGATIIEKHFTLDKNMEGPDHKASLNPQELKDMVNAIRNIELAIGSGVKRPTTSELKNINVARRSIHLQNDIQEGHIIKESDIIMKRPGNGISPMQMEKVIGKKIIKSLKADEMLKWEYLQ
ncbi:MAG TPA: N-acetylneuraminate synthase [Cytophagaceae bacterium]|jgi:N,N'-diacetyllegionaminate synthase|nr:N-acetylneuraminate synthase [Cytophagaceae bacterium]